MEKKKNKVLWAKQTKKNSEQNIEGEKLTLHFTNEKFKD